MKKKMLTVNVNWELKKNVFYANGLLSMLRDKVRELEKLTGLKYRKLYDNKVHELDNKTKFMISEYLSDTKHFVENVSVQMKNIEGLVYMDKDAKIEILNVRDDVEDLGVKLVSRIAARESIAKINDFPVASDCKNLMKEIDEIVSKLDVVVLDMECVVC